MVTLHNRRDYSVSVNGKDIKLKDDDGVVTVPAGEPVTQEELDEIPEADIEIWIDKEIRAVKLVELNKTCNEKIEALVPNGEKNRWETMGLRLAWKRIKHLKSPGNNQDLTPQEEELADQLDTLGESTEAIREARDLIREDINASIGQILKDIDTSANSPRWPQVL